MARPSRPWFRFYVEAVHDRKLRRLKPEHRWLFVACLAAARQSPDPGVLLIGANDPMGLADLADFAGMRQPQVADGVECLIEVGVLRRGDLGLTVPAWNDRQYESDDVTARTQRHRAKERSKNVAGTAEGTPPETETETDTPPPTPAPFTLHNTTLSDEQIELNREGLHLARATTFPTSTPQQTAYRLGATGEG